MGYEKLKVTNGKTKWTAELLSHVEDGIVANENKIAEVENKIPDVSNFATKEEIPDVSNFQEKGDYATKDELPDVSNFATKDEIPNTDNFATKEELPSVEGLASEVYVNETVASIPNLDLLARFSLKDNCLYFDNKILLVLSDENADIIRGGFSVLFIGNSYSENTAAFMHAMAKSLGINDIEIAVMQYGGRALSEHSLNKNDYSYIKFGNAADGYLNSCNVITENKSLLEAVTERAWTWIVLQQASKDSGKASTYSNLQPLIDNIKTVTKDINPDLRFAFNMTWAWQEGYGGLAQHDYGTQMDMYNSICSAVQEQVATSSDISVIMPVGTAIQTARGLVGDNLNENGDGSHLNGNGSFVAGLAAILSLLVGGEQLADINAYLPNTYAPFQYDSTSGRIVALDQLVRTKYNDNGDEVFNSKHIANYVEAVIRAIKHPFELDASYFMDDTGKYSSTKLSLADQRQYITPTWPEQSYTSEITGNTVPSHQEKWNNYCRTCIFTPETLPVGSTIQLGSSWNIRPHKWPAYNRCAEVEFDRIRGGTTSLYTIDEEFWMGYEYAAFDIDVGESTEMASRISRLKPNALENNKALVLITPNL